MKADTLTVATSLPAPGFWNGDDTDSLDGGYEWGMANAIAKLAGLKNVEFKNVSFDALQAGQTSGFDVAFSQITITPDRAKVVCFTDPYFSSDQGVLVKKGTTVATVADAKKLKWGVQGTTTGQTFLNDKIKPDSDPRVFQDTPAMFTALDAGSDPGGPARHGDRARSGRARRTASSRWPRSTRRVRATAG